MGARERLTEIFENGNYKDVTFHDEETSIATGTEVTVNSAHNTLLIEIYGTSTSRTLAFKGKGPSGTARSIFGVNRSTANTAISTNGTGELWEFGVEGLSSVIMDLTAVAGGNVSVKGRFKL